MGKSAGSPPEGVDYQSIIPLQGSENRRSFDYMLGQSRVNQQGPGGSQRWERTPYFNSSAYNTELSRWQRENPGAAPPDTSQMPPSWGGMPDVQLQPPEGPNTTLGYRTQSRGQRPLPAESMMRPLMTGGDPGADGTGGGPGIGTDGGSDPGIGTPPGSEPGNPGGPSEPPPGSVPPPNTAGPGNGGRQAVAAPLPGDFINYQWNQITELSPEQQQIYDRNVQSQIAQAGLLQSLTGRMGEQLATPFSVEGMPARGENVSAGQAGDVFRPTISREALPGTPQAQIRDASGGLQAELARLSGRLEGLDPSAFNSDASDALYRQTERYLNPQVEQNQRALEARLAEQGFVPGTPAYNQAMDEFRRGSERSFADARDRALTLGTSVGNTNFGNSLQSIQAQIAAAMQGGNFQLSNDQMRSNEGLNLAQFGLGRQAQDFGQQVTSAGLGRQSVLDSNQVAQQLFDRQLASQGANNANRQNAIAEALMLRSQPINELNAIRSGTQVQMPNFGTGQPGAPGLGSVDLLGAANSQYGQQLNAYNAAVGQDNQNMQTIGQIAALVASMYSDRRLKTNVVATGQTTPGGVPVYEWTYIWGGPRFRGVMADDVPHARHRDARGFWRVDYSKVR